MQFQKIDKTNIKLVSKYLSSNELFCDFSPATLFMWADFFNFEFCIEEEILFVKTTANDNASQTVFFPPFQKVERAMELLSGFCLENSLPLVLSPVSLDFLEQNPTIKYNEIRRLSDWSDYIYRVTDIASLVGKKFNAKRNHVKKFTSTYNFVLEPFSESNAKAVLEFLKHNEPSDSLAHIYEHSAAINLVKNRKLFNLLGAVLLVDGKIVGVTIAEVKKNVLFVHIEKADRSFLGVYEALAHLFAKEFCQKEDFEFFNREEDMGFQGLRQSKLSWNPIRLAEKFSVWVETPVLEEQ